MSELLTIQVTEEEGGVTIYCPELDIVTCGPTVEKARENFSDLVEEYYLYLVENADQLDEESRAHLNTYHRLRLKRPSAARLSAEEREFPTFLTMFFVEQGREEPAPSPAPVPV